MKTAITVVAAIILVLVFLGPGSQGALYTVDETQLVVVTRFGKIQTVHTQSGLKVKVPFIDTSNWFDKRLLRVDMPPAGFRDVDKQNLIIDAYARYRITDARKFFEKLGNLDEAADRIQRIVEPALRDEIARSTTQDVIGAQINEEEGGERTIIATDTRQEILDRVFAVSARAVGPQENDFGIEILDVRIKRAEFPDEALENIFNRMRAERIRISNQFRAEGDEEAVKIRASANKDRTILLAEAERDSNILRGSGDAEAIKIFAEALEKDPEFYSFVRSLEAYKIFLATNTTVVLSSDAELFQFLQNPGGNQASDQ
jgi:membrane protease subunit HflC